MNDEDGEIGLYEQKKIKSWDPLHSSEGFLWFLSNRGACA